MREWFKYEFGYVNIDPENLYLTHSGNWSEIKDLPEKTQKVENKNSNRSASIIGFIVVSLCLFGLLIVKSIVSGKVGLTLIALTLFGGYKLYQYLKTEVGAKFKIPLVKISEIKQHERTAEIIFINGEGNKDSYTLHRMDEKGVAVIHSLKRNQS